MALELLATAAELWNEANGEPDQFATAAVEAITRQRVVATKEPPKPRAPRARDPLFDAVQEAWPDAAGGLIGKALQMIRSKTTQHPDMNAPTAESITVCAEWVKREFKNTTPMALGAHWIAARLATADGSWREREVAEAERKVW